MIPATTGIESARIAAPGRTSLLPALKSAPYGSLEGQSVQFQERQLVPISALERDLVGLNLKEAATTQAEGVAPFENRPIAVFEKIFDAAHHRGGRKLSFEHRADGFTAVHRIVRDLMVDRVVRVQRRDSIGIAAVES